MAETNLQALSDECTFHRSLGIVIRRSASGVELDATLDEHYMVDGANRTAHGGVVASLLDIVATFALIARTGQDWVTVDLRVDYIRPTSLGAVQLEGEVVRAGKSIGRARGSLLNAEGVLCAVAIGTFAPVA